MLVMFLPLNIIFFMLFLTFINFKDRIKQNIKKNSELRDEFLNGVEMGSAFSKPEDMNLKIDELFDSLNGLSNMNETITLGNFKCNQHSNLTIILKKKEHHILLIQKYEKL